MSALNMMPVQWSSLEDIDGIEPLNKSDENCLQEIYEVLKKHGKQDRLGIALLHKHFDLQDNEIMLEVSDHESRELVTTPVNSDVAGNGNVGTIFALRDGNTIETMSHCHQYCKRGIFGNHFKAHEKIK